MTKERRKNERQPCLVPVESKQGSAFAKTQTIDISRGGIGLISKKKIPVDKTIAVELDFPGQLQSALVLGKIQWVSRIAESPYYRVGMLLKEDLSAGSKTQLKDYLDAH